MARTIVVGNAIAIAFRASANLLYHLAFCKSNKRGGILYYLNCRTGNFTSDRDIGLTWFHSGNTVEIWRDNHMVMKLVGEGVTSFLP